MQHDDVLGEPVSPDESDTVQRTIMAAMLGQAGEQGSNARQLADWHRDVYFPGSQPVSLARSNLELLHKRRYWVRPTYAGWVGCSWSCELDPCLSSLV